MGEGILNGSVRCCMIIFEHKVLAQELVYWRCPLEAWIVFLILDQQGSGSCCKGFSRAASEVDRVGCSCRIWKFCDAVALSHLSANAPSCLSCKQYRSGYLAGINNS
jgi:hypothetical protein